MEKLNQRIQTLAQQAKEKLIQMGVENDYPAVVCIDDHELRLYLTITDQKIEVQAVNRETWELYALLQYSKILHRFGLHVNRATLWNTVRDLMILDSMNAL